MGEFWIKDGGTWQEIEPGNNFYVKDSGAWQSVQQGWVKDGGTWHQFYQNSDEVLYTFKPTAINSWRPSTTWRSSSDMRIGSYSGYGDHWSLFEYMSAVDENGSGLTIAEALAERPVVKACTLELTRSGGGSSTINAGEYHISWNSGSFGSGAPTNESTYRTTHSLTSAGWSQNTSRQFTGLGDLATKLGTNSVCVANNLSPLSSGGGNDADYTNLSSTAGEHRLFMRLDYV